MPLCIISYFPLYSVHSTPYGLLCSLNMSSTFQLQSSSTWCALGLEWSSKRYMHGLLTNLLWSFVQMLPSHRGFSWVTPPKLTNIFSPFWLYRLSCIIFSPYHLPKVFYCYSLIVCALQRYMLQENKLFYCFWSPFHPQFLQSVNWINELLFNYPPHLQWI